MSTASRPSAKPVMADWLPLEVSAVDLPIAALGEPAIVIGSNAFWSPYLHPTPVTAQNVGSGLASLASRCVAPPATSSPAVHI